MLWIPTAFAQFIPEGGVPGCDFATGDLNAKCIPLFIAHVIKLSFGSIGGVCLVIILIAGYRYLFGTITGADTTAGKEMLIWAITGFIVSALTFFIIDFIISTLAGV